MTLDKYYWMLESFNFEYFMIKRSHRLMKKLKTQLIRVGHKDWEKYNLKYAAAFREQRDDSVLFFDTSSEPMGRGLQTSYLFYLKQLPSLCVTDVAMLFALMGKDNYLLDGVFEIDANFKYPFAASIFKDTYGKMLFDYQFTSLLSICLPVFEKTPSNINDYLRALKTGQNDKLKRLQTLTMPDGTNLAGYLKENTPIKKVFSTNEYGQVVKPTHKFAYQVSKRKTL